MDGPRYVTAQFAAVVPPMVLVSGGTFSMGLQGGSAGRDVTVGDFYLDTREVTVGDYRAFCTASGRPMPPAPPWGWADTNLPVVNVSWTDADAFAAWAGKRLPTEAEYEYAMRAGNFGAAYPWGDAIDPSLANYGLNVGRPTAAGTYPITGAGVLDIAGNVWEWCADWYRSMLTGPVTNPVGPAFGTHRVIRGGSWANPPERLRCAPRYALEPDVRWVDVGFRCARTAKGGTDPTLTGGPWFGAYDLGEGWRHLAWFGVFWDAESGWIWHPSHGWIWATAAHPRSVWLWTTDLGWLWSGSTFYPWLWRASDRTWIYYYRDTDPRAFWNSATGQVEWR
jgi:hypothetical protein